MTAALPMGGQKITGMADPTMATDGATKSYVDTTTGAFFSTGDLKPTLKTVADAGWVLGGGNLTIGNAGSGATSRANVDCLALYTLIWNNISSPTANAFCSVTGGLGASAAADWAGLKPLSTGWYSGRALGFAGSGGSLTTRTLGSFLGEEGHTLLIAELPTGITSANTGAVALSSTSTNFIVQQSGGAASSSVAGGNQVSLAVANGATVGQLASTGTVAIGAAAVTSNNTGSGSHNNMQPTFFSNVMIKL